MGKKMLSSMKSYTMKTVVKTKSPALVLAATALLGLGANACTYSSHSAFGRQQKLLTLKLCQNDKCSANICADCWLSRFKDESNHTNPDDGVGGHVWCSCGADVTNKQKNITGHAKRVLREKLGITSTTDGNHAVLDEILKLSTKRARDEYFKQQQPKAGSASAKQQK